MGLFLQTSHHHQIWSNYQNYNFLQVFQVQFSSSLTRNTALSPGLTLGMEGSGERLAGVSTEVLPGSLNLADTSTTAKGEDQVLELNAKAGIALAACALFFLAQQYHHLLTAYSQECCLRAQS